MFCHAARAIRSVGVAVLIALSWGCGSEKPGTVRVSGNIEVTDADVGFKISGRVLERAVSEGDLVTAGQLVARLEDADVRQEVAVRKAEVRRPRSTVGAGGRVPTGSRGPGGSRGPTGGGPGEGVADRQPSAGDRHG